ncbi:MAG TPA: hypothetical protein V6C76_03345 [Drouetiella sp.]
MFAEGSPELDLAEEMEAMARSAELTYLKTHHYPQKLDQMDAAKRVYRNPFTGQLDKTVIQTAGFGKKTQNDDGGMRKKLYDTAVSGARWPNEPKRHAGEISCYSAVIHTKKGDINTFYVRGFDRDSKPLVGHDSVFTHAIVLENNKVKPIAKAQLPFKNKSTTRPRFAWIIDESALPNPIWVRFGGAILLTFLAFATGIASVNINSNTANALLKIVMAICTVLTIVCLASDFLP